MSAVRTNAAQRSAQLSYDNQAPDESDELNWTDHEVNNFLADHDDVTDSFRLAALHAIRNNDLPYLVRTYERLVVPMLRAEDLAIAERDHHDAMVARYEDAA